LEEPVGEHWLRKSNAAPVGLPATRSVRATPHNPVLQSRNGAQ
jgi:hypothetical protein